MRLVTAERNSEVFLGAWIEQDSKIVDLKDAAVQRLDPEPDVFKDMQSLIDAGPSYWARAQAIVDNAPSNSIVNTADCQLLAPLPRPAQIRDFLCFEEHLLNSFEAAKNVQIANAPDPEKKRAEIEASGFFDIPKIWYERPLYYTCSRFAVCGPDADVVWPVYSEMMDYELEFAAVIGLTGKDIHADAARDHIFGYMVFNDFSARDEQTLVMEGKLGPGKGKDFDNANAFGPCIVTADELGDPYDLTMTARVNDEEWSRGSTSTMYHKFEDIIANVSRSETLRPGEVICSGTVGTGSGIEHMRFLQDGDVVELEIERIGVLRNRVLRSKPNRKE